MKIVKNILFWSATVALIMAIMAVAVPKFFGVEFRAVLTGSMEPEIPVGSLVVIVPAEAEDIDEGDDITFVTESNKVVTHRVYKIDREKNTFTTYGIANGSDNLDPENQYENIIGVVRIHLPKVGTVFTQLSTPSGKIITVTAIIAVFLISFLLQVIFGKDKEKEQNAVSKDSPPVFEPEDAIGFTEMSFEPVSQPEKEPNPEEKKETAGSEVLKSTEEKILSSTEKLDMSNEKPVEIPSLENQPVKASREKNKHSRIFKKQRVETTDAFWNGEDEL